MKKQPTRDIYVRAIAIGFAVALPLCWWLWAINPTMGLWRFSPLLISPLGCLFIAAGLRLRRFEKRRLESVSANEARNGRTQHLNPSMTRLTFLAAAPIVCITIPLILTGLAMLCHWNGPAMDFWPHARLMFMFGAVVSTPLSLSIFLAGWLP